MSFGTWENESKSKFLKGFHYGLNNMIAHMFVHTAKLEKINMDIMRLHLHLFVN